MRKLIVGFSKPKGRFKPLASIIRRMQGVEYSHVFFQIKCDKMKNDFFYHASGSVVNFMGTSLFFKNHIPVKVFEFDIDDDGFYRFLDSAIDKVGLDYSFMQLVGFVLVTVFKLAANPFGKGGFVCSELVAQVLRELKLIEIEKDTNLIDLNDIYNTLKIRESFKELSSTELKDYYKNTDNETK